MAIQISRDGRNIFEALVNDTVTVADLTETEIAVVNELYATGNAGIVLSSPDQAIQEQIDDMIPFFMNLGFENGKPTLKIEDEFGGQRFGTGVEIDPAKVVITWIGFAF